MTPDLWSAARESGCDTPATHIWAGETPSAPCSISLYQKHPTPCSSFSRSSSPVLNAHHKHLNQVTGNEDVSASCPQPGNSLMTLRGLNESNTCLSGRVKERAHASVTLAVARCMISGVITPNSLKEIITHITLTDVGLKPS